MIVAAVPDVVVCEELAFLLDAIRALAWSSHCNVVGLRYVERREAFARLRGALISYDRRRIEGGDVNEEELFRAYRGLRRGSVPSASISVSADDERRRLVSDLRREESGATGLPSRPTRLPPADASDLDRFRDLVR